MRRLLALFAVSALCAVAPEIGRAEISSTPDGGAAWQSGDADGPHLEINPDGSFKRMYSEVTQTVTFPDRQGIQEAKIIAEEKAKAAIVSFMQQHVATGTLTTDLSSDVQHADATRQQEGNGPVSETISKNTQRLLVQAAGQLVGSYSAGVLQGVRLLEWRYDNRAGDEGDVTVRVRISLKSITEARQMQKALQQPGSDLSRDSKATQPQGSGALSRPPDEIHSLRSDDW